MSVLADIRKAADAPVYTCTDDTTPAGYFAATTKILGITVTYLLAGVLDDPAATVVGRIEHRTGASSSDIYRGDRLKGGVLLPPQSGGSAAAFRLMVDG